MGRVGLALYKKLLGEMGPNGLGPDDLEGLSPLVAKGTCHPPFRVLL